MGMGSMLVVISQGHTGSRAWRLYVSALVHGGAQVYAPYKHALLLSAFSCSA